MHLAPEDQSHDMILEAVAGENGEVACSRVVIRVGEASWVNKIGVLHAQLMRVLVHFENEEANAAALVLLVVVLLAFVELLKVAGTMLTGVVVDCELKGEELAEILGKGSTCVVA